MLELRPHRALSNERPSPGSIAHAEVGEGVPPSGWDEWVQALGGGPFHCASWARYRASTGHKRPLFFAWYEPDSRAPAAVALGIETALPGPLKARSIHFDSPPATRVEVADLLPYVERWMRTEPGVADAWFGSFDAQRAWTEGATPATRIEFRVAPAPPDELLAQMRVMARRSVRRAQQRGIEIDADSAGLCEFVELYGETLERLRRVKGVSTVLTDPDGFVERLTVLRAAGTARLFLASAAGEPVAGALFTTFGRRAFYLAGGTSELGRRTGAMTAVLYRAMTDFSAADFTGINLGGVSVDAHLPSSPDYGLYEFKRGLGGVAYPCRDTLSVVRPARHRLVHGVRAIRSTLLRLNATPTRRQPR
jgi:Acetyltransferase (GNAT) domain